MTNRNEQPYVFEGGTQEENHRRFYVRPPKNANAGLLIVGNVKINYLDSPISEEPMSITGKGSLEESCGYDPNFVALETD